MIILVLQALEEEEKLKSQPKHVEQAQHIYAPPSFSPSQSSQPAFQYRPISHAAATVPSKTFQMIERRYSVDSDDSLKRSRNNVNDEDQTSRGTQILL